MKKYYFVSVHNKKYLQGKKLKIFGISLVCITIGAKFSIICTTFGLNFFYAAYY